MGVSYTGKPDNWRKTRGGSFCKIGEGENGDLWPKSRNITISCFEIHLAVFLKIDTQSFFALFYLGDIDVWFDWVLTEIYHIKSVPALIISPHFLKLNNPPPPLGDGAFLVCVSQKRAICQLSSKRCSCVSVVRQSSDPQ